MLSPARGSQGVEPWLPKNRHQRTRHARNVPQLPERSGTPLVYSAVMRILHRSLGILALVLLAGAAHARPGQPLRRLPHRQRAVRRPNWSGFALRHLQDYDLSAHRRATSGATGVTAVIRHVREVPRAQGHAARVQPREPRQPREPAQNLRCLSHRAVRRVPEKPALQAAQGRRRSRADLLDLSRRSGRQPAVARSARQAVRAVPRRGSRRSVPAAPTTPRS